MSAHVSQSASANNVARYEPVAAHPATSQVNGIYGEDDSDDGGQKEDQSEEVKEIIPSKSKYDKFVEEVKVREIRAEQRIFPEIKVDPQCEVADVKVFQDYSVKLTLPEVNFSAQSHDRVLKMQLLERKDGKKWFLWIA